MTSRRTRSPSPTLTSRRTRSARHPGIPKTPAPAQYLPNQDAETPSTPPIQGPNSSKKDEKGQKSARNSSNPAKNEQKVAHLSGKTPNHRRNEWQRTNYRSRSPADKLERAWRQLAKPPAPREGSTRAKSARNVALARAWRPWSDIDKVVAMYRVCAVLNELGWGPYCVDHIVPLQGVAGRVAGFHTHDNLQVITVAENKEKGYWWWPQMWQIEQDDEWSAVEYAKRTLDFTL